MLFSRESILPEFLVVNGNKLESPIVPKQISNNPINKIMNLLPHDRHPDMGELILTRGFLLEGNELYTTVCYRQCTVMSVLNGAS